MKTQILAGLQESTGEIIYSRAQHDYIKTSDNEAGLDGGQAGRYNRVIGKLKVIFIELDVDCAILYDDWNNNINKYGRISPEEARNVKILTKEEVIDRDTFEFRKNTATWGTYGIDGKGPKKTKLLINLETDHLQAILRTQGHISAEYKEIIKSILADRGII